jgi:hypothetical protein
MPERFQQVQDHTRTQARASQRNRLGLVGTTGQGVLSFDEPEPTLAEVLARLGWTTSPRRNHLGQGKAVTDADGNDLGDLTAGDTWRVLRERGLVA